MKPFTRATVIGLGLLGVVLLLPVFVVLGLVVLFAAISLAMVLAFASSNRSSQVTKDDSFDFPPALPQSETEIRQQLA